ncbi:hypothetical protein ACHJH3_06760 [Campylobacter sp. MOP7]|uniref:hypothetical protein n=1 Tax=Campylobacter canis TaxID=3378588 RepID=UPI00387ED247
METTTQDFMKYAKLEVDILKAAVDVKNPKDIYNLVYYNAEKRCLIATDTRVLVRINEIEFEDVDVKEVYFDIKGGGNYLPIVEPKNSYNPYNYDKVFNENKKGGGDTCWDIEALMINCKDYALPIFQKKSMRILELINKSKSFMCHQCNNIFYFMVDGQYQIEICMAGAKSSKKE